MPSRHVVPGSVPAIGLALALAGTVVADSSTLLGETSSTAIAESSAASSVETSFITSAETSTVSRAESGSVTFQTTNWIDTISGYDELSTCAEQVLSTVVRGEFSGCGDNNAVTSYTCFCTDSSSHMSAVISKDIMSSCPDSAASAQASSALGVFKAYCALGVNAGLSTQTISVSSSVASVEPSSASPAGTLAPATATITVLSTPTNTAVTSNSSTSPSSKTLSIVIGVSVPICGLSVLLAAWFLWRRHKQTMGKLQTLPEVNSQAPATSTSFHPKPTDGPNFGYAMEIATVERPVEIFTADHPTEVHKHSRPVELPVGVFRSSL